MQTTIMNRINTGIFSIPIFLLLLTMPYVYAGGPRLDYDMAYQDIEGAPECWVDGYDAGFAGVYDKERAKECNEIPGDQYNASWDEACRDGNHTESECTEIKQNSEVRIGNYDNDNDRQILRFANMGKCWDNGYKDGSDNSTYNFERASNCGEYGSLYYHGFIQACEDPTRKEVCESYTQRPLSLPTP